MKLEKIDKKNTHSLYGSFLWMTLFPMCLFGIVMMVVSSLAIKNSICDETEKNLQNVARTVLASYDTLYDGDYNISMNGKKTTMWKGDHILSNNYDFLDDIADKTGTEISFFFYDTRLLTTIRDKTDTRMINTGVNTQVLDEVFSQGREVFYDNVVLGGRKYFAYYEPLYSEDGSVILGMIGVASPASIINKTVNETVAVNAAIMILAMGITAFFILRFASQIVSAIKKMMEFLKALASDDLEASLDEKVTHREDELGTMGRAMVSLQISLRRLIERDVLTGLYNRRSAEKKIDEIEKDYGTYCVAIGDIDHFKLFNDTYGHGCGDAVLREVARTLNDSMKGGKGFVARWGGEEFLLVYEGAGLDEAYVSLLGIRDTFHKKEIEYDGQKHKVTMTFGVEQKKENMPINLLIRAADDKLYEGKQNGRDRVIR